MHRNNALKITFLILLILALSSAGAFIFDKLNIIDIAPQLSTLTQFIGLTEGEYPASSSKPLNEARLRAQIEAIEIDRALLEEEQERLSRQTEELQLREQAITDLEAKLREQYESLAQKEQLYRDRIVKVERIAQNFNQMPPEQAVAQMNEMDPLLLVDILRAADRIAQSQKENSLVPYWISQMPAKRAAEINRLMVEKP